MTSRDVSPASLSVGVVVVAAGSSSRMNGVDKLFYELDGVPVVARAIEPFCLCECVREIVVACRGRDIPQLWDIARCFSLGKVSKIVAGGSTRQESVFAGVRALDPDCSLIAVHDGARAFVSRAVIEDCLRVAAQKRAACAAVPVKDTIKRADEQGQIVETPPRASLYIAQTPQAFDRALYLAAMENAAARGMDYTDDCQLIEAIGHRVTLSPGSYLNFKITTPEDLYLAQSFAGGEVY